jgi:hypothetical protein
MMIANSLEWFICRCLDRWTLVGGNAGIAPGVPAVLLAPKRDNVGLEPGDMGRDPKTGEKILVKKAWMAAMGDAEGEGVNPSEAVEDLYRELGRRCESMLGYHQGAIKAIANELQGKQA